MKLSVKVLWFMLLVLLATAPSAYPQSNEAGEGVMVGRISYNEGEVLRFVPDTKEWVVTVKDAPFGFNESIYASENGKAEFIIPNGTWARIGGSTHIQLVTAQRDSTVIDVGSGMARFYNKGSDTTIKVTTPFGYTVALPKTSFDLYVGEQSVEVVALQGKVNFVSKEGENKYEVEAGSTPIVSDGRQVGTSEEFADVAWNKWNLSRDGLWTRRLLTKGRTAKYLPASLGYEAHVLEENGRWERVWYRSEYHYYWHPIHVHAGWAPFTVGRWTDWYGDNCWIPGEPFGYVTHHYGNWVSVSGSWYWAPPAPPLVPGPPTVVQFAWYPGRVAWIHSGENIGWVPLAPDEPYYCYHQWGPRAISINVGAVANINLNIAGYRYADHAVVVNQSNFYTGNSYVQARIPNIGRDAVVNSFRVAPVPNKIVGGESLGGQRYLFTNSTVSKAPPQNTFARIQQNQSRGNDPLHMKGQDIRDGIVNMKSHDPAVQANIARPRVTGNLAAADPGNKPPTSGLPSGHNEIQTNRGSAPGGNPSGQPPSASTEKGGMPPQRGSSNGVGQAGQLKAGPQGRESKSVAQGHTTSGPAGGQQGARSARQKGFAQSNASRHTTAGVTERRSNGFHQPVKQGRSESVAAKGRSHSEGRVDRHPRGGKSGFQARQSACGPQRQGFDQRGAQHGGPGREHGSGGGPGCPGGSGGRGMHQGHNG